MSIRKQDWKPGQGERDAKRHRDMVKEEVKKKAVDAITDIPVIGRKGKIKIWIKGKKSYSFQHGKGENRAGIGQGKGKVGDVISRRPKQGEGEGEGRAGNQPGEDWFETEIDIEEVFEWLCEELGLPKLKKKEGREIEVKRDWKQSGVKKKGIRPHLREELTVVQAIERISGIILGLSQILEERLGKKVELASEYYLWALNKAKLDNKEALKILQKIVEGKLEVPEDELKKATYWIDKEDLRFKKLEEDIEYESNAVIFALMDVSGSMTDDKKKIAKSFYWFSFRELEKKYANLEIVFIAHHSTAKVVSEEQFFHKTESGGTFCGSAYRLARELIETEFSPEKWNVYVMHFSDGEDWESAHTVEALKKLLPLVNAFGYGEIQNTGYGSLLMDYIKVFSLQKVKREDIAVYVLDKEGRYFIASSLKEGKDIWPVIQAFFSKEEVAK